MNKNSKYYDLTESIVKQNKKFVGNEMFLDDIVNDVLSHADIIIQSIDNEDVIKEFLTKTASSSIITISRKMNKNYSQPTNAEILIDKINNQDKDKNKNINKQLVDNFINGTVDDIKNNQVVENISETDDKQITYEQLSEITVNDDLGIEFGNNEITNYEDIENSDNSDNTSIHDENIQPLNNNNVNDIIDYEIKYDPDYSEETANEINNDISDQEYIDDNNQPLNSENNHDLESFELSLGETTDNEPQESNEEILKDANFELDDLNDLENIDNNNEESVEIDSTIDDAAIAIEELATENDQSDNIQTKSNNYNIDNSCDIDTEEALLLESEHQLQNSIYNILSFEQNPLKFGNNDMDMEKIFKNLNELSTEYPELNIINVYNLRYKDGMAIDNISNILGLECNDVIHALNLMSDIV